MKFYRTNSFNTHLKIENTVQILKILKEKFKKILKMEISLTSRQDTICWIYEQEIKDFYLLLDHGLDIQTMISLCFKNGDSIIKKLENGISLNESFCFKNKNFENTFRLRV